MSAEAKRNNVPAVEITDDFDDFKEVTGVRDRISKTSAAFENLPYPNFPDRVINFEKSPMQNLAYELEGKIDEMSMKRMLKIQIVFGSDDERREVIEETLQACQKKNKLYGFESSESDGKAAYTVYYKYT